MIDLSDEALLKVRLGFLLFLKLSIYPLLTLFLLLLIIPQRIPSELEINESHADHAKIACLLCQRQFKTADVLSKHMEKSDLHKTNMTAHVKKLVVELREKLEKEGAAQMQVYRNRAAERRKMHGQTRVDKNSDRWR